MRKRITSLALALVLCLGLTVSASAAGTTQTFYDYAADETWTIPNVSKIGRTVYMGAYIVGEDEYNMPIIETYDPSGFVGYIFNDSVGAPVYYISGDSVTLTRKTASGDKYLPMRFFNSYDLQETGNFTFDSVMSYSGAEVSSISDTISVKGTGFAKYTMADKTPIDMSGTTVTLGKGVWSGPESLQGFTSFVLVVGEEFDVQAPAQPETPDQPAAPSFTDVPADAYYAAPVAWAVEQGITAGTTETTFSPNSTCTRAQIITFLWRAVGSPEPVKASPFTDVPADAYYAKAAAWAAEQGMVSGASFAPGDPCTRAMAVEFMWKQAGSPDAAPASFTDAASPAVNWAVEAGVTSGTTETTFSPDATCTRAQIVTFLYRAFA